MPIFNTYQISNDIIIFLTSFNKRLSILVLISKLNLLKIYSMLFINFQFSLISKIIILNQMTFNNFPKILL